MSPRSKKQFEDIREERKRQIIQVALELFAQQGFSNITIADIAKNAKISKGLIYNYFESKEQLIMEIILLGIKEFGDIFDPNKDGKLTYEELHFFIDESFRIMQSNIKFWRLYFIIMFQPAVFKLVEANLSEILGSFMKLLLDYFTKKGYADPLTEMRFFGALMDGISLNYVLDAENFPLENIKKKIHEMYK